MSWRTKLKTARDLRAKGCELLFDRVTLLVAVYEDAEFLADCDAQGTEPLDMMDDELADTGQSFMVLRQVLASYPKRADWSRRLAVLIAELRESSRRHSESGERTSWKSIAEQRQQEIDRLTREVAVLTAKLEELRGLLSRELAAA